MYTKMEKAREKPRSGLSGLLAWELLAVDVRFVGVVLCYCLTRVSLGDDYGCVAILAEDIVHEGLS